MAAHKNITKLKEFNSVIILDFYDKSKSIEEIAEYYHLDIPLTWAIILEGKEDLERFELFGESDYGDDEPKLYNLWNFSALDPRLGIECPGNIPGQVAMNLLYYYTKQGGLVVDPEGWAQAIRDSHKRVSGERR